MNRSFFYNVGFYVVILFINGCAYQTTQYSGTQLIPDNYAEQIHQQSAKITDTIDQQWWQQFNMPQLNLLINELVKGNYDLAIAQQRVVRARALLGQQKSRNWPTLDASFNANKTETQRAQNNFFIPDEGTLNFTAAYEVDLWGRRSAANHAATLGLISQQSQYKGIMLTLQAQLAQQYFELLALQDRIIATQKNLSATKSLLKLVKLRFDVGRASGVELDQQRNILLNQNSQLLILQRDRSLAERALAVLLGRDNLLIVETSGHLEQASIPLVSIVQPAVLLQSRPDIQVAEAELRISDAALYQNKTRRWPTLQLSAQASLADVFNSDTDWTTSFIGGLTAPLFNAGRISNDIAASKADASIALQTYRKTVVQAMQETLDSLTRLNYQREIYSVRQEEVATNKRLFDLARQRFDAGNIDFINLLDVQRSWFSATERVVDAKRDYLTTIINLYRAMGVTPQSS